MSTNDGGAAFPIPMPTDEHSEACNVDNGAEGMTVRQFYKAAVMTGLVQNENLISEFKDMASRIPSPWVTWYDAAAHFSGEAADSMIAEDEESAK